MKKFKNFKARMLLTVALIVALVATSLAVISASAETNSEPSLRAVGISLDGQVNLKFKYSSLGDADSFKVDIFGGHDFVVKASDIPLEGSDRVITVNLLPSQMMRKVTVTPFFGNTPGAAKSYSVLEYAEDVIAREEFSAYHDTVRALLNWGSFVEMNFENTYDGLASNTLFANYTNPAYSVSEIPFTPVGAASLTESFKGGDVFLSFGISNTSFNINIDYTGSKPDNVRLTLYGDNVELGEYPMTRLYDGEYSHAFRIGNIGVSDYDTVYKLVITDGTESITLQKSVLEYLNWNIGASSGTAENEKNICRSLYQLYQLTAGATDENCSHISSGQMSDSDVYLLPATENTSYVKCAHCFALLSPSPIPNSVDKYLPGDILSHAAAITGKNDGLGVSGKTDRINVGSAKYLVIKGKSSKASSLSLKLSTEGYNGYGSFSFGFDGAGTDTVFVVRLTDLFGTQYKKTDGNYVIDTFYLTGAENADIEYIAFVHDRLEVEKLVGAGKTVKFIYNTSGESQSVLSSLTCTDGCNVTETKTEDVNSYIYSYSCSKCKAFSETKSVPKSIGVYWSFNELNKMSNEKNSEFGNISDDVVGSVYRISGTGAEASDAQELFFRNKWDSSPVVPANGFPSTVDVGQAKYFVIKVKKNSPGFNASLTFSTTAVNRYTDATQKTETGIGTNYNFTVPLPTDTEWRTIVFNAAEIASKYEMKDGKYVLDNMIIGLIGIKLGDQLDIEYFAVANTWDEIDAIVDEKSVYYLTGSSGYAEVIDIKTKTVHDSIGVYWSFNDLDKMSNEKNSEFGEISDDVVGGVYRISGTGAEASDAQELFFRNKWDSSPVVPANGFPSTVDVGQAKYFVIKIKKNSPGFTASLTFSTTAVNRFTDETQTNETGIGTNYNSTVPLPTDTEWRTIVFNAAEIASKYEMKDGKYVLDNMIIGLIGIKLGDQLDIEYFAVANTWDEIDAIVDEKSVYYLTGSSGSYRTLPVKDAVSCDGIHVLYNSNEHWYEECEEHHVPTTERTPHNYDYNGLYYTCVNCGFIPRCNGEHTYTAIDDKTHSISACEYCGFAGESGSVESHTYITNEKGEYICSLCKNIPECKGEHDFTLTNGAHSMSACNICGAGAIKAEEHNCFEDENHVYKCSICKLEPSCHGIHEYEMTAKGHTQKACAECGFGGGEFEKHVTFDCNDTACYVCGYKLSNGHSNLNCDSKCDRCGAEVADDEPYIITPKMLFDMTSAVVGSIEIINENGTDIFRINSTASGKNLGAYWINNPEDLRRQNTEGIPLNVGDAKYIVIKYRSVNNNFRMHISTSAVSSTSETDQDGTSSLMLLNSSGSWTYYVMDASKALLEWDKTNCVYKPDENGDYIIDTFFVELTKGIDNRYLDFEFIAFANDAVEIDSLISKDTSSVNYVTSTYPNGGDKVNGTTNKSSETVSGGKIQHIAPEVSSAADGEGNTIYTAVCTKCGFTLHTRTVKNYVDYFLAPNVLVPGPFQSTTTFMLEDGESYYRMTGKNMVPQHIWLREKYYLSDNSAGNPTGGGGSKLSGNLNIGNATYMIVKLRTNDTAETVKFRISTTGYNYNPSKVDATNIGIGSVASLIQITASKANEWTTYAVDLTTLGKFFAKDTSGNYIIDTFCLMQNDLTSTQYIDIAYIAFVEKGEVEAFKADMDATATEDVKFEWESETESTVTIIPGKYQNASGLNAAGASWSQGLFASTFKKVDETKAVNVTAAEMLALLSRKDGVKAGEVYRVSGALNLASDTTYYGNFAAIIADGGVFIKNASNTSLRDIIIKGNVTITNSSDISLHQVEIRGGAVGLSIDSISSRVSVSGCAISATDTAVNSAAANVSLYRCRLVANTGVRSTGSDMTVQDCIIKSEDVGIESSGNYFIARSNTITRLGARGQNAICTQSATDIKYKDLTVFTISNSVANYVLYSKGIRYISREISPRCKWVTPRKILSRIQSGSASAEASKRATLSSRIPPTARS